MCITSQTYGNYSRNPWVNESSCSRPVRTRSQSIKTQFHVFSDRGWRICAYKYLLFFPLSTSFNTHLPQKDLSHLKVRIPSTMLVVFPNAVPLADACILHVSEQIKKRLGGVHVWTGVSKKSSKSNYHLSDFQLASFLSVVKYSVESQSILTNVFSAQSVFPKKQIEAAPCARSGGSRNWWNTTYLKDFVRVGMCLFLRLL
ncbi:hypothetical protein BDW02DRAFT_394978 [Decorospora gaudefroyi]|uniref:Uncharacterized protein n=1 Tax=Decorospora gaudefroyi TaxID=184978 RepID=A0A6A5KAY7_9PLEO|nr:hypothetical protein BDW02DRAFT_394978 [Decorospora gaudefroyi]